MRTRARRLVRDVRAQDRRFEAVRCRDALRAEARTGQAAPERKSPIDTGRLSTCVASEVEFIVKGYGAHDAC